MFVFCSFLRILLMKKFFYFLYLALCWCCTVFHRVLKHDASIVFPIILCQNSKKAYRNFAIFQILWPPWMENCNRAFQQVCQIRRYFSSMFPCYFILGVLAHIFINFNYFRILWMLPGWKRRRRRGGKWTVFKGANFWSAEYCTLCSALQDSAVHWVY